MTIAAGLSASAVAVRKALGKEVDKRADRAIAKAVEEARAEIREEAKHFLAKGFMGFVWITLGKAALFLAVALLFISGVVAAHWLALVLGLLFLGFTTFDFIRAIPTLKFLRRELKRYGWRPKHILTETISAQVFERVLERASGEPVDRTESVLMLLAGRKRDEIVEKVARAVAAIASTTSWDDIKPMIRSFVLRMAILFSLYFTVIWTLIYLIRQAAS